MSPLQGQILRGLCAGGAARGLLVECRSLCEEVRKRHGLNPCAARLAAEGCLGGLLMTAWIKGEERITLQVRAIHPAFTFTADVDAVGGLRARLQPGDVQPNPGGIQGQLVLIKHDAEAELYRGATEVAHPNLEGALAEHMVGSSQVDAVLRLVVEQGPEGEILHAVGMLVERLPEDPRAPSMGPEQFAHFVDPLRAASDEEIMAQIRLGLVGELGLEVLAVAEVHWRCSCSRERVLRMLYQLGPEELLGLLREQGRAEVACHFCNIAYEVSGDDLRELLGQHGVSVGA
jgi:molecular chaperone Hsp33